MEKELGVTQARQVFGTMVEQVQYQGDTFIIHRHGKPAAAMVPLPVYEAWKRQRQELFDQIRQIQRKADLEPDEADRLAAGAVAAARA
jgi:antitoxin (DNA-binding transcriptional repressor) of toxin-antitoxin stability system